MRRWKRRSIRLAKLGLLVAVLGIPGISEPAGLGIPLDGFMTSWQQWVIGLGIIFFITGLAGWAGEKFNTPYQPALAGSMGFFTTAGLLGGGSILAGLIGLVPGATLPL